SQWHNVISKFLVKKLQRETLVRYYGLLLTVFAPSADILTEPAQTPAANDICRYFLLP
ncbi:unnamed protein product, partial [Callosobruchus maculatus]